MKKALLYFCCILMISSAEAQTNNVVVKFSEYFKANQPDSIYSLFNAKMKAAIKLEGTTQLITQVKSQLGEIVKFREVDSKAQGFTEFRLSFEKPLLEIALIVSRDSIAGIFQKAAPASGVDSADLNSPDNYSVENKIGKLYGTLTLPKDKKKVPIVLMIGGSGPTDRNMNQGQALKTNSFMLLAKGLAENGIATLRYDKRGVGKSEGAVNASNIRLDDFIDDAKLFLSKLASDDRFSDVVVLGHSEGGLIGLIASLQIKPAAYISLCGFKNNMVTLLGEQLKPMLTSADFDVFNELADSLKAGKTFSKAMPGALAPIFTPASQAFLISTLKYDASEEMKKLKVPVLVIGGTTDLQIPEEAATQLAKMNKRATLMIVPEMNHVLKKAPSERMENLATYNNSNLPLHKDIIPIITDFIKKNCGL